MTAPPEIRTRRLLLRDWREADRAPFGGLNADPEVAAYLPSLMSREESDALADRIESHLQERGFGLWAVEVVGGARFIGFVGLSVPRFQAHFTPCVEVGWRLARDSWGFGYATEGALAALDFGFDILDLDEIVAYTMRDNVRSRAVMHRIGMTHDPADDFEYPLLPEGHPLRPHVLYRLPRDRRRSLDSDSLSCSASGDDIAGVSRIPQGMASGSRHHL